LGNITKTASFFNVKQYPVESVGDALVNSYGLNNRDQMGNGSDLMLKSWRKETGIRYFSTIQGQYYNDPHDISSAPIKRDQFQYYDREKLFHKGGRWWFSGKPLNIVSSIDFAYSLSEKGDWSSIVVVGADGEGTTMF